ncbi:MAG: pyridoxal-phosphate dependent enzyme [Candidatus Pacebacteria bacterium]|nr:pyridoxal-phosphate dependent enzyme [Candidatus Paceibacterota bacterium]
MSNFQNKINKQEKGIWRYVGFYDEFIEPENRLVLESRGLAPVVTGAKPLRNIYFKREDENMTGSLKDRSLSYQVSLAKQNGKKELVISTSGNAGIAAAAYCQKAEIKLHIFISPDTGKDKIVEMQKYNPIIIKSKKAIRLANYLSARYKTENLRPSINDSSIEGFKSIAFEIFERLGEIDALFSFVTSGSSFAGIGMAYKYLLEKNEIKKMPKLYAVQSGNIFSIAGEFEKNLRHIDNIRECRIQAGRLGVKNTRRKKEIIELIQLSGGSGLYIKNKEFQKAAKLLEENNIYTSTEGCASFSAAIREGKKNNFNKIVCILSGKLREKVNKIDESKIYEAESFEEVDEIVY